MPVCPVMFDCSVIIIMTPSLKFSLPSQVHVHNKQICRFSCDDLSSKNEYFQICYASYTFVCMKVHDEIERSGVTDITLPRFAQLWFQHPVGLYV